MILNKSSVERGMCRGQIYQVCSYLPALFIYFCFLFYSFGVFLFMETVLKETEFFSPYCQLRPKIFLFCTQCDTINLII